MFQPIKPSEVVYCPDCGQPYHISRWEASAQRCVISGCFGSTKIGRVPLKVVEYLGVEKSELSTLCSNCERTVSPLERFCSGCGHEVNTEVQQKTFFWYPLAKWTQENERKLITSFATLISLVVLLTCGVVTFTLYQGSRPSTSLADNDMVTSIPVDSIGNAPSAPLIAVEPTATEEKIEVSAVVTDPAPTIVETASPLRPSIEPTVTPIPIVEATTTFSLPTSLTLIPTRTLLEEKGVNGFGDNQIVYASEIGGYWSIFAYDMDSGQERLLLGNETNDNSAPVWSPDGTKIAFHSQRDGNWDIYIMDVTGDNLQRLTSNKNLDLFPTWSPDGSQLAFHSNRNGNYDLYIVNIESETLRQLTNDPGSEAAPSWSPDGTRLAFAADYRGNSDIYIFDLSNATIKNLVELPGIEGEPVWSPDGKRIAFASEKDGDYEIFVIDVDGDNLLQLTSNAVNDGSPTWSPDGSKIIYESWQGNQIEIYIMEADGSEQQLLNEGDNKQRFPDWL